LVEKYDIAVIGSGPAGQKAAIQSAKFGKRVVVIDRREYKVGGVSLHSGTIPSKTLREAVLYLKGLRRSKIYGSSHRFKERITIKDLLESVELIIFYEMKIIESQLKRNGVELLFGQASFLDEHTLEVRNRKKEWVAELYADKIIIATGTVPRHPEGIPFDYKAIFDSDLFFTSECGLKDLPTSMIIYGAGVIGMEYASMFAALGCKIWLIDRHVDVFPFLDNDIIKYLKLLMSDMNITFILGQDFRKIDVTKEGQGRIHLVNGSSLEADIVLFSKGRLACIDELSPEKIGLQLTDRKLIKVNEFHQTSLEHIYACGDVIGFPALASTSAEQGRMASRHALNLDVESHRPELFPIAIYSIPEISTIGKTETDLIKEEIPYVKGIAWYREIAKAAIFGDDTGLLKMLFHAKTKELLGIHIIGEQASEIIHIGQVVMAHHSGVDFFLNNVFNYPSWAEAYKVATLDALNRIK
jgi:NAD(P) transhydrogenase